MKSRTTVRKHTSNSLSRKDRNYLFNLKGSALAILLALPASHISDVRAQDELVAGANINMVSGIEFPGGDPFLQRQNEPSLAVSTRNPLHLLGGANDYRTVDIPGLTDGKTVGDSWPGLFTSVNGGGSWVSTLIPGFPQDTSETGQQSPLKGYEAGADPVIRAGTNGLFYYSGIVFDRGHGAPSAAFVSRFMDLNNDPSMVKTFEDSPVRFIDTQIVDSDLGEANDPNSNGFIDKPWLAVDIPRPGSQRVTLNVPQKDGSTVAQTIACGPVYMAYAQITGEDTSDIDSHIMFSSSTDCGSTWSDPRELDGDDRSINQGTSVAIDPATGTVFVSWRQFNQATLQCTRGSDFWEQNPGEWPVERFMLGGELYDQEQALGIMAGSQNGNPWRLSREMITAKLNLLAGLNNEELQDLIDQGDEWLVEAEWVYEGSGNGTNNTTNNGNGNGRGNGNGNGRGNSNGNGNGSGSNNSLASQLADYIELYNTGEEGPGDCSTFPSGEGQTFKPDAIMAVVSNDFGQTFSAPVEVSKLVPFDQGTTLYTFRNNSYPTMAVDDAGRAYIAWSTRNRTGVPEDPEWVDSRIVISSSTDGLNWSAPQPIDHDFSSPIRGHQIQPSLAFNQGKLMMIYLDFRQDRSEVFERYIADVPTDPPTFRHTVDVRAAIADPGVSPEFTDYSVLNDGTMARASTQLSRYFNLMLQYDEAAEPSREQLQYNPLNQPLFKGGTVPFIGDYIDLAPSPAFIPVGIDGWSYNTGNDTSAIFHAAWSDNRDVRGPPDGDWTKYVPPENPYSSGGSSLFDPTQTVEACVAGVNDEYTGMRNQNIYTSRITQGIYVGIPSNSKPLREDLPRSFVVFAKHSTNKFGPNEPMERAFKLRILNQPTGGVASFNQTAFSPVNPQDPVTEIQVNIGRNSSTAQTVFATSTNPKERIEVEVYELNGTLRGTAYINPDPNSPAPLVDLEEYEANVRDTTEYFERNLFDTRLYESLEDGRLLLDNDLDLVSGNPDGYDLLTQSLSQLSLTNPDLFNPGIYNPGIYNPGIYNPGIYNPGIYNPGIYNPGIYNPGIYNPGIYNPGIYNPGIYNPGIYNGTITDVTYTIENDGETTSAYDVNIRLDEIPVDENGEPLYSYQLVVSRFSTVSVPDACDIIETPVQEVLVNNTDPDLLRRLLDPNSEDSFYLNPGDSAVVTLRIIPNVVDENEPPPPPPAVEDISVAIVEDAVDEPDFIVGDTQPDVDVVLSDDIAPLLVTPASLPQATGGEEYSYQFAATGGFGDQTFSVVPGTFLPRGLELSSAGLLFGTPLEGGTFNIAVRVTDDSNYVEGVFPLDITAPPDLAVIEASTIPPTPLVNENLTFDYTIGNLGDEIAPDSLLVFEISDSGLDASSDATSDAIQVGALLGGETYHAQFFLNDYEVLLGNYEYRIRLDANDDVLESNELNNLVSGSFSILPPVPDIYSVLPTDAAVGQRLSIQGENLPNGMLTSEPELSGDIIVTQNGQEYSRSISDTFWDTFRRAALPSGLQPGPATMQLAYRNYPEVRSNSVPITVSAVPSAPIDLHLFSTIAGGNLGSCGGETSPYPDAPALTGLGAEISEVSGGQIVAVSALGITASETELVLEQNGTVQVVSVECRLFNTNYPTPEYVPDFRADAPVFTIPEGFSNGPINISMRHTINATGLTSPNSAPLVVNFSAPAPEPVLGEWILTDDMPAARRDQTASLLPDGRVLIVGGMGVGFSQSSALIFDPTTGAFTSGPDTVYGHGQGSRATTLLDGRILISGGNGSGANSEIYDPASNSFTAAGSMVIQPREYHSATRLADGRVLIAGGFSQIEGTRTSIASAEIYDPVTNNFTLLQSNLFSDRASHGAALLASGEVVLLGGLSNSGTATSSTTGEIFDPVTSAFRQLTTLLPAAGANFIAQPIVLKDGKVLFPGQFNAVLFDPATEALTLAGSYAGSGCGSCATSLLDDGRVLFSGGYTSGPTTLPTAEIYDPDSDSFSAVANMNVSRQQHTTTVLAGGLVLAVGGSSFDIQGDRASAELYWPVPNKTAWLGNIGGAERPAVSCPAGETAVGFAAIYEPRIDGLTINDYSGSNYLYNSRVYTAALRCATVDSNWDFTTVLDSSFVDYWGSEFATSRLEYTCNSGEVMVGILGTRSNDYNGYRNPNTFEGLICQNQAGDVRVEEAGIVKGPDRFTITPAELETIQCGPGLAVTALEGWSAAWMDRLRFSCAAP